MPIKINDDLPARQILEDEHIFVMTNKRALTQDIRPLKIVILNLMPTKIETETQILRCLSNTPLQIEVDLMQTSTYTPGIPLRSICWHFIKPLMRLRCINMTE